MRLEDAKLIIEYKMACRDAPKKDRWLKKRDDMPTLPSPMRDVIGKTNVVKSSASKFLNWLADSNGVRFVKKYTNEKTKRFNPYFQVG